METQKQHYPIGAQTFSILMEEYLMSLISDCEMKYGVRIGGSTPNIRLKNLVYRIGEKTNQKAVVLVDEKDHNADFHKGTI